MLFYHRQSIFRFYSCRTVIFDMTTEQQVKSVDNCHINGAVDQNINPTNDEIPTITTTTSPDVTGRHSRFFRTKRKQRLGETSTNINGI